MFRIAFSEHVCTLALALLNIFKQPLHPRLCSTYVTIASLSAGRPTHPVDYGRILLRYSRNDLKCLLPNHKGWLHSPKKAIIRRKGDDTDGKCEA